MHVITIFPRRMIVALICLLALAAPALGEPATAEEVAAPDIKLGDSWLFDRIDGFKNARVHSTVATVIAVDDQQIKIEWKRPDDGTVTTETCNRGLNRLVSENSAGTETVDPFYPRYVFPLEVGKTWERTVAVTRSRRPERKIALSLSGKVVGRERITVPAGTFDALKVEVEGFYNVSDTQKKWTGRVAQALWYAPAVKHAVKWTYEDTTAHRTVHRYGYELVEYRPGP